MALTHRRRRPAPTGDDDPAGVRAPAGDHDPAGVRAPRVTRAEALVIGVLALITLSEISGFHDAAYGDAETCSLPEVVSHRGLPATGSENTLASLSRALDAGSGRVELDVRFTRDHHPVLMHDATVGRTTTGSGRVSAMTLARFRALRTTDGQRPPTLAQALRLLAGRAEEALVELKQVPDAADLRSLRDDYRRSRAHEWADLSSFSPAALAAVRSIPARKGLLATAAPDLDVAGRYSFVGIRHDSLTMEKVAAYREAGVPVYAWTANDAEAWWRLSVYGVDRILTDRTDAYLSWAGRVCDA